MFPDLKSSYADCDVRIEGAVNDGSEDTLSLGLDQDLGVVIIVRKLIVHYGEVILEDAHEHILDWELQLEVDSLVLVLFESGGVLSELRDGFHSSFLLPSFENRRASDFFLLSLN